MPEETATTPETPSQPRDEAGRFAAATPDLSAAVSPSINESSTSSPAQDAGEDPYVEAYAKLFGKQDAAEPPAPVAPADKALVSSPAAAQPESQPVAAVGEVIGKLADYDDMDASLLNLLRAEKKLPPTALWNTMSPDDRHLWAENVKHVRNARNRNFNAGRESQPGKQSPDSITPSNPAQRDEIPGNSQPTPKPRDAGESHTQLPPDVQEDLAGLAAEYGEDSAIYRSTLRMAIRNEERIAQIGQVTQQVETERAAARLDAENRHFEDTAAKSLAQKFPQLTEPAKLDLARQSAREYLAMRSRQGLSTTAAQAMEWGAMYHFSQENKQQAQQTRNAALERSLNGSLSRNNRPAPPSGAPASEDEGMARIWDSLSESYANNRSGSEARNLALRSVG